MTYDDGPGPHTVDIAVYLHSVGVRATFFVVGQHVRQYPDTVGKLAELGHLIGNHTDTHTDLLTIKDTPEKIVAEVLGLDRLIAKFLKNGQCFFRPPFGKWNPAIADALNRDEDLRKYTGPIHWNIDGADWQIGSRRGRLPTDGVYAVEQCADAYREKITAKGSGVVLLHDWSADAGKLGEHLRRKNRTLELTKLLIPQIAGFKFVSPEEISMQCDGTQERIERP